MKRAFPQKANTLSCPLVMPEVSLDQTGRASLGRTRKTRRSAAMIGLALSMGASGLILPRQDDAAAAEPTIEESTSVSATPATFQSTASLPQVESNQVVSQSSNNVVTHTVTSGQTLWQLARTYQTTVDAIADANGITLDTEIRAGQVLIVPLVNVGSTDATPVTPPVGATPSEVQADTSPNSEPGTPQTADRMRPEQADFLSALATSAQVDSVLKAEQDMALNSLRTKQEDLQSSLLALQTAQSNQAESELYADANGLVERPTVRAGDRVTEEDLAFVPAPAEESDDVTLSATEAEPTQASELDISADLDSLTTASMSQGEMPVSAPEQIDAVFSNSSASGQPSVATESNDTVQLGDPSSLVFSDQLTLPQVPSVVAPVDSVVAITPADDSNQATAENSTVPPMAYNPQPSMRGSSVFHEVSPGDTLNSLAQTYNVPANALIAANGISDPNFIFVGQLLQIPAPSSAAATPTQSTVVAEIPVTEVASEQQTSQVSLPLASQFAPIQTAPSDVSSESVALVPGLELPTDDEGESVTELPIEITNPSADQLAVAPHSIMPSESSNGSSVGISGDRSTVNPHVEQLLNEILVLRDQSQSGNAAETGETQVDNLIEQPIAVNSTVVEASGLTDSYVVPEFSPSSTLVAPVEADSADEQRATEPTTIDTPRAAVTLEVQQSTSTEEETDDDLVAVAPLGAENYQPLIEPITGRMVSPGLPPLPGAENFLPNGTQTFNGYIWPASGVFTSGYGWRWGRMHRGIDVAAPVGTPIFAAAPGTVEFSGWNSGGYGNMVDIRHPDGSLTRYAHNNRNLVQVGQQVDQGQQIAEMGSTGYSTGPHVHFEIHVPAQGAVNPIAYLP